MSASGATRLPVRGELSSTSVPEVLRTFEAQGSHGRLRFDTELGVAEVDFAAGQMLHARMGDLVGRSALFRLIGIVDGQFEFVDDRIDPGTPLVDSVEHLIALRAERVQEWRRLSEHAPPFSAVLRLTASGQAAATSSETPHDLRLLLGHVDGRHSIAELIDVSELDAVDALTLILSARERGLVTDGAPEASLFPMTRSGDEHPLEPAKAAPKGLDKPEPTSSGISLRKSTVIGMGIAVADEPPEAPAPALVRPKGAAVQRIIKIEGPPGASRGPGLASSSPPPPSPSSPPPSPSSPPPSPSSPPPEPTAVAASIPADPLATAPKPARQGSRYLGRYEVLCRIGRGGMGSVYLCRLTSEGGFRRLFALKLLRSHLLQDSAAAQNFLTEARLAGQIHHPNVVSVVDAGLHDSHPYLVMDYVEGGSLKELLSTHVQSRPPELILSIVLDALAGLNAAHTLVGDNGVPLEIVHCDVSPENLIVGIDGVCRLSDFGVARQGPGVRKATTHGKPGYLAPEQILGSRVDRRADVFSIGVVLYNALTGIRLFEAPTTEETLQLVCTGRIDPPSTVGLRPPPALDFVCMKALEREPERRFSSAEEMMMELRRIALRENLLAPTTEVAGWVRASVGRELAQRRLALLDASRTKTVGPASIPSPVLAPDANGNASAPKTTSSVPPRLSAGALPDSEPPTARDPDREHFSRTIVLPPVVPSRRKGALIVASSLAALVVLVTMLWPGLVSKLFRVNTEGFAGPIATAARDAGIPSPNTGVDAGRIEQSAILPGAAAAQSSESPSPAPQASPDQP